MDKYDIAEYSYKNGYEAGVKDLADRLKKKYDKPLFYLGSYEQFMGEVDNILKEMVGDK